MSDDLFLNGKKLISVSRASKETGYTSDYIGQLCRQKKVPARLVGRTWFVDIDSLSAHKISQSSSKRKKAKNNFLTSDSKLKNNIANNDYLGSPRSIGSDRVFKYETEKLMRMPLLNKVSPVSIPDVENNVHKVDREKPIEVRWRKLAVSVVAVLAILSTAKLWFDDSLVMPMNATLASLEKVRVETLQAIVEAQDFLLALATDAGSPASSSSSEGIVIWSDSADRDARVEEVKRNFSDDVTVVFDEDGTSGVVRPIFRSGADEDNYAFVLVPIKQDEQ